MCTQHGINERERANRLSDYLHDLGVFLHFQDDALLRRYVFLQNEWVTNAVYRVLDDEEIKQKQGRFNKKDTQRLWKEATYAHMHEELLALMRKFELCYELRAGHYLVPQLLSVSEPETNQWSSARNLQLRYRYDFMPKGLLSRFTVRMHRYVNNPDQAWRSGVILERDQTTARVVETWGSQRLSIHIQGANCKEFMTLITEEIDHLHESYEGIVVDKLVPCICRQCKGDANPYFYKYKSLKIRKEKGKRTVECDRSFEDVEVEALLDAVFVTNFRREDPRPLKAFISYSKADTHYLESLKKALMPLQQEAQIMTWDDRTLVPGEEWDDRIKSELATADMILLLVSSDSMATEYIQTEVNKAMERHYQGNAVVVPIILRPCMWNLASFSRLSALPQKGKPISQFNNPDEAWLEVVKELGKTVQRLKARKK